MGLRFRKSIKILPGVKLNLSKSGVSVSLGGKGLHANIGTSGRLTGTASLKGTGLSYSKSINLKKLAKEKLGDKGKETKEAKEKAVAAQAAASAKETEIAENRQIVEEYEALIEGIKGVHKVSDPAIDWNKVANDPASSTQLKELAGKVLSGDPESYLTVVAESHPFDDLLEYGSGFEVGTDSGEYIEVEFLVKSEEVVPTETYSLLASGKLSEKPMAALTRANLILDYVCSTVLRVASDSFALLPVKRVIVHATDSRLNPATGHNEEITILSASIERSKLEALNLAMVDPSDAMSNFTVNLDYKKTTGFAPVQRLEDETYERIF
jgi:hypothetical protein